MKQYQYAPLLALALATGSVGWAQQSKGETSKNWHQLGLKESGFYGINLNKAYEFLKARNAKSQTVVVAVMDSGIDTLHEDLKPVLWVNPGEIPGNGKDDDKNGYPDDRYGWNFLGGKDGTNINEFSSEASRLYHQWRSKYEGKDVYGLTAADQAEYELWKKAKRELFGNEENKIDVTLFSRMYKTLMKSDSVVRKGLGNDNYTGSDLNAYKPQNSDEKKAKDQLLNFMKLYEKMDAPAKGLLEELGEFIGSEEKKEKERTTAPRDWRGEIVKDNPDDLNDRNYGNSDVMAGRARHGTHVAGIIGAVRNNGKGMDGVADNVRLMIVRVVPDGDEQDKDVANGIRYAVDNGAQVINMSFGKAISPQKAWVDEAVKYAERKGVLLVHAAGNDNEDVDVNDNFPVALYNDGKRATNWITVGASGDPTNGGLVANFSNYGKKEVDVFAPGVDIYSTVPGGNTYDKISGTSMAAPVVSGLAALLLEYFPTLSAQQVKMVIERSAVPIYTKVVKPGSEDKVPFVDLSKTGGIVDAFAAVKLAATLKGERKVATTAKAVSLAKPAKAKKGKEGQ